MFANVHSAAVINGVANTFSAVSNLLLLSPLLEREWPFIPAHPYDRTQTRAREVGAFQFLMDEMYLYCVCFKRCKFITL